MLAHSTHAVWVSSLEPAREGGFACVCEYCVCSCLYPALPYECGHEFKHHTLLPARLHNGSICERTRRVSALHVDDVLFKPTGEIFHRNLFILLVPSGYGLLGHVASP